jgi:hypothetical protein
MDMFASGHEAAGACTEPARGLPPAVLDHLGSFFESQLPMSADRGGLARGPGACAQDAAGMGVVGLGHRSLAAWCTAGIV